MSFAFSISRETRGYDTICSKTHVWNGTGDKGGRLVRYHDFFFFIDYSDPRADRQAIYQM